MPGDLGGMPHDLGGMHDIGGMHEVAVGDSSGDHIA
jgi:hypothetical protein